MQQDVRTTMGEVAVFANGGILIFKCTKGAGVGVKHRDNLTLKTWYKTW